jgi:streptomycin 6-kinase
VDDLLERWQLTLGPVLGSGAGGHAYRVERADGTAAVLKVSVPHRESLQEAEALARWDGDGAIRLLEREDAGGAMLVELCEPGTPLSQLETGRAMDVIVDLLPRLWVGADGFHTLVDEVEHWAGGDELKGERLALARELAATQGELVLCNQDLHGDNVLAAQREPWLLIDPKPLAAEREFQAAPIVRSPELGHSRRQALYRLDRLCGDLGLDRERARLWTIVHTTAWSEGGIPSHLDTIDWLA